MFFDSAFKPKKCEGSKSSTNEELPNLIDLLLPPEKTIDGTTMAKQITFLKEIPEIKEYLKPAGQGLHYIGSSKPNPKNPNENPYSLYMINNHNPTEEMKKSNKLVPGRYVKLYDRDQEMDIKVEDIESDVESDEPTNRMFGLFERKEKSVFGTNDRELNIIPTLLGQSTSESFGSGSFFSSITPFVTLLLTKVLPSIPQLIFSPIQTLLSARKWFSSFLPIFQSSIMPTLLIKLGVPTPLRMLASAILGLIKPFLGRPTTQTSRITLEQQISNDALARRAKS